MQLKFKKICLLSTVIVYFASFLIQSDFGLFQARAQERNNRVNIVAVLVDSKIYSGIEDELNWYATQYVQQRLSDTKALVIPLDLKNIHAYDIYRMMENIYFDGLKDVNSTLIGLIMFGDIPLPVVNQNGYIFPTVYPYVDFESQKYVWDSKTQYFVPNDNPRGQAEIWHGLINYGENIGSYKDFFNKIRKYDKNPEEFIGDSFWYDDFIAQKKGFLNENFPYYRNRIMFAEDLGYQRYSPLMRDLFVSENSENAVDIVSELGKATNISFEGVDMADFGNPMYTTKMVQQEIDTSLVSDYTDLFSQTSSSTMRENLFAGGRWSKEYENASGQKSMIMDLDNTISKIQIKDDLLLGNDKMQGLIENLNDLMENVVDKKIEEKNLSMDIVIPLSLQKKTKKRITFRCVGFVSRFENHYFGSNARFIDKAEDLSIYRGTYRNLLDLSGVSYDSLLAGKNPIKTNYEMTDLKLKSIGGSYDVFSSQAEGNRGYTMTSVERDLDIYDEEKTTKDTVKSRKLFSRVKKKSWPTFCKDDSKKRQCETLYEFAKRWWGGASTINLINESVMAGRYELSGYLATDSWRSIFGMDGFQSLLAGDDEGISGTGWYHGTGTGPQWDATSFRSYIKYSSPTETKGWKKKGFWYEEYDNHTPDVHTGFSYINYRNLGSDIVSFRSSRKFVPENSGSNIFTISTKRSSGLKCGSTTEYAYKVINSVVKHKSTTEDQINGIDRDKYGDTGTLGKYYRDVRTEYEELQMDMNDIINEFPGLIDLISSGSNFINEKMKDLYSGANALSQINGNLSGKESQISGFEAEIEGFESEILKSKSDLEDLNSQLENAKSELESAEEGDTEELENLIEELENSISDLEKTISDLEVQIENLRSDISGLSGEIALLKSEKNKAEDYIISVLSGISKYIGLENSGLANVYKLIQGLYVENIVSTLSFIAYLEGGNPDDYYAGGNSSNLVQVGFLPSWISNINRIVVDVKKGESKIIDNYEKVYSMIQDQQNSWSKLAKFLKELSDKYTEQVDKVSSEMDQIFFIHDDGENNGEEIESENIEDEESGIEEDEDLESGEGDGSITLTGGSARVAMNVFERELGDVSSFFNKLIVEDKVGPAIVKEAKDDEEFLVWLYEQETGKSHKSLGTLELLLFQKNFNSWKRGFVNGGSFSDVDWINNYAQWASGPGYNSDGAKKNRDLLVGVSEHMSGMNLLTHDRPIDSPRYTVMQSVAGREMKFIYPDLFKVEVYALNGKNQKGEDRHILLTGGQIKKNLIKYLSGKVEEYNRIVKEECNKALNMDDYYKRLRVMGYTMATPDVSFRGCDEPFKYEDFVEALGGTGMLDTISEVLYYQNLTNTVKFSSGNVEKDMELIRESFSLNDKREQILTDYLTEGNEEIKNPVFEIPTYELSGYEVAYINSDGRDYIFPSDQIGNDEEFSQTVIESSTDSLNIDRRQRNSNEREFDNECNIPPDGRLPLFEIGNGSPWWEGFRCWLKRVQKEPIKLKLTFDNSLGDILTADSFKDFIRNSELGQTFIDRKTSWQKYEDDWTELLNPSKSHDSDREITELQVRAEQRNQKRVSGDDSYAYLLSRINENIRIENSNVILSDSNPTSNFKIESIEDIQNVTVTFFGTGDSCIKIDSNELCDGNSFSRTFNPKTHPFTGVIEAASNVAGKVGLIMQISAGGDYIERIVKYTISPGALDYVNMKVGDVKTVAGMITPITVTGYDRDNNVVSWGLNNLDFTVSQGRFLKDGAYQDSFKTKDLRNLNFYYQAPLDAEDESIATIKITSNSGNKVWYTHNQRVVQGNPEIKLNGSRILWGRDKLIANTGYTLKSDESVYVGGKLSVSRLQRLDIDMRDSKGNIIDIDTQITVNPQNGLVVLGSVNRQNNGEDVFFETSLGQMIGGHLTLYYYPTTVAGDEVIRIDIPGLDSRIINLKINPGAVYNVQFNIKDVKYNTKKQYVGFHETEYLEVIATDVWGNRTPCVLDELLYDPRFVEFYPSVGGVYEKNRTETIVSNKVSLEDPGSEGYKKIYLYGTGAGATSILLGSPYASIDFKVTKHILPESGLNIMYLNYFGNDWGNQWGYFSDNKKHVESLMTQSNKIITTTTQLVSQNKIKKIVRKIDPGFLITNFENVDTNLIMNGNSINIKIGGLYEMKSTLSSLKWVNTPSVDSIFTVLSNEKTRKESYAFFIPNSSDYKIVDGVLFNDGERIASIINGELTLQLGDQTLDNNENIWDITYKGVNYGSLIIHSPSFVPEISTFGNPVDRYLVEKVFSNGSSDALNSVGVFDGFTDLELGSSYKSIQNSDELEEKIGFLGDFKNITLFAEGEIVGEATKKFGSELLINLGDPVLSRKSVNKKINGTEFDGGIGQEIYTDTENDIFGTYQIDFDKDGSKDWLVVFLDGSLKLAKNYGGYPDLKNMQELMRIAVHIRDVYVGDADGNGYEDILVYTDNNQIRAYLNERGIFDVDGNVACLNQNVIGGQISDTPTDMEGLNQFFVDDMDLDGKVDIITYDKKGYIKVFFGGSVKKGSNQGPNYLSTGKYYCDTGWYDREVNNTTVVAALGVQVVGDPVFDNSMMHWTGMKNPDITIKESELPLYGINFDPKSFEDEDVLKSLIKRRERNSDGSIEKITTEIMDKDKFDVETASKKFIEDEAKYVEVELFENVLGLTGEKEGNDSNIYTFAPSSYLDPGNPNDKCSTWKNYRVKSGDAILMDGDIVTVKVTVKASAIAECVGAFGDVIQGPRNVYYDENNIIKGFKFLTNRKNAVLKKKDGYFAYLVDNITLAPGEMMTFEYDLEYHHMPLKKMSITYDTFYGDGPDIKLQSVDGCVKDFDVYHGGGRLFPKETIYLQKMIDEEYLEEDEYTEDFASDVISYGSDANKLPGIVGDRIDRVKLLQSSNVLEVGDDEEGKSTLKNTLYQKIKEGGLESLNMNLTLDLSVLEEQSDMIENVVDEITQGMCNGFSFGGSSNCKGLPVPFNQAFLAPGKYHLFGCWELPMGPLEGGIPMFFFPGTLKVGTIDLPIPWGLKHGLTPAESLDGFLWPLGGTFPSFIRIYAAPTLTAQLGIAICMGNYKAATLSFPSPIGDIAGNCIVFAVKPQCKNGEEHNEKKKDRDNPHAVYEDFTDEVKNSGICLQSQKGPVVTEQGARPSPFNMYSFINTRYEYRMSRDEVVIRESQMDDILDKIQEVSDGKIDAKSLWEDALKGRIKIAGKQVNLSILDMVFGKETIDKLYDKYFADAKLTAADGFGGYPEYKINDMGMIILETTSYVGPDEDNKTKNSIFIGDVDILGGDYTVNKIKGGIQQGIRKLLIDKWLDPQIRYIANQLTKMHVNIKLPDLGQVIDGEGQFIKNLTKDFKDIWSFKEIKNDMPSVSKWEDNNYDNLVSLNRAISNPFESLASLLNESNLINVSVEPVTIRVPRIFAEDINAYELYLRQWLEVNSEIVKEWEDVLSPLVNNCSKIEDEKEKADCYNTARSNLDSFIEFEGGEWRHLQDQIYANLVILQEYRNFPFEIYEWIHVIDRYMSEIISLISSTIGYLSFWTSTNAERFVGYVDAIVLILNIIKTYQIVIDFSKEWGKNCGTCSKDTYDQYSCKLSLLCSQINLPIIQIPNFKLPNITLDLSDINLSLDLVLPSFNFQPVKINLPDLPNLPNPPSIGANIRLFDLPNIPILPEPPELPELPSFIPEIDLELPILPPAPEIPKLPNEIEATVKIAQMIGKIYCIVKGKFGMVGEKSVKAKIEQLTQRTYEVSWIDNIMDFTNMISTPVHNYGLDYEISSHVDLQFNFLDFYSYLDTLTKSINNLTDTSVHWVDEQTNKSVNSEYLQGVIDGIDRANVNFNVDLTKDDSLSKKLEEKGLTSDEIEYTDYNTAKSRLENVLTYIRNTASDTNFSESLDSSINKIENQISKVNKVEPNLDGLEKIRVEITSYLDDQRKEYDRLANLINNDYDGFLAMLDSEDNKFKSDLNTGKVLTFNLQLFNVDSSTKDNINLIKGVNPYVDLMENKKDIIDGYWNAVNSNTANDLGLTQAQYLVLRDDIMRMKNQITTLYSVTKPISSTELIAKNSRVSTNKTLVSSSDGGARLGSNMAVADVIDPSVLSNGIYEKIIKGPDAKKLTKVVYSDSFVSLVGDRHYHTTHSQNHDIVLWDDNSIYLKCNGGLCNGAGGGYKTYYHVKTLDNIPYEEKWISFDKDTVLKIADVNEEVKNRKVVGQTYDILSFSWDLEAVDGYLIKLVDRIDYSYEKQDFKSKQAYYVLALPKSVSLSGLYDSGAKLELLKKKIDKIENLNEKGDILQIVYYDANKDLADVTLSNVDRKWYYARIATLNFTGNTYEINSPWSNQIVAGKQIVGDEQEPEGIPELFRPSVDEVVSQGDDLDGYVGTWYDLIVNWRDNVALYYINLSKDGEILDEKYTSQMEDKVVTKLDLHKKEEKEVFNSVGIDQFGNKTEKVITVNYSIPEITITDISKNLDGESVAITAELSQDIDQGNVSFQRRRGNAWKTMVPTGGQPADIPLEPKMTVVGNSFSAGNEIAMYDKNGEVLALIDPDTAELKIQPGYEDEYEIKAVVQDKPVLQVCNKKSKNSTFSISLPVDECQKIEADNYKIDYLDENGKMGVFNGGRVVHKDGNSILFVSPDCRLYSEYGLEGTYDFDAGNGLVILTLYQTLDTSRSSPIKIRLKVKPLVEG